MTGALAQRGVEKLLLGYGFAVGDSVERWLLPEEPVALNNCDREPIHIPNAVQSHGALFVLDERHAVVQHSRNLQPSELAELRSQAAALLDAGTFAAPIDWNGGPADFSIHNSDGFWICEVEPRPRVESMEAEQLAEQLERLHEASTLEGAFQRAAQIVAKITGFERVVGYLFGPDGHGSVISEVCGPALEPLIGLRFPATDIPVQARRLYVLERARLIPDVSAEPVALEPEVIPALGRRLNMAHCSLRAVSPIHLQYLKNMGVGASGSFSVVIGGELAGLIACHHHQPRPLPLTVRRTAARVAGHLSRALGHISSREQTEARAKNVGAQIALLEALGHHLELRLDLPAWERLTELVDSDSLLLCDGPNRRCIGAEALDSVWDAAAAFAEQQPPTAGVRKTQQLGDGAGPGGGLLVVPMPEEMADQGWVAWYRKPEVQRIVWAGPKVAKSPEDLTPRASFQAWEEVVSDRGPRWSRSELDLADTLHRGLAARFASSPDEEAFEITMRRLRQYVAELETANTDLRNRNEELRQMTYVVSHDFGAPIRSIRTFSKLLAEHLGEMDEQSTQWLGFVERGAETLSRLQSGLANLSRVGARVDFAEVDLTAVVELVVRDHEAQLGDASVVVEPLPAVWGIEAQLDSVFRNLIGNSIKYAARDRPLRISVRSEPVADELRVVVEDNGVGFPSKERHRVFEVFTRLHPTSAEGDGIGLALCRRVMEHHRGLIQADSELGRGCAITLIFPKPGEGASDVAR